MKKLFSIFLLLFIFTACQTNITLDSTEEPMFAESFEINTDEISASNIIADDEWLTYRNEKYGFEFEYPRAIYDNQGNAVELFFDAEDYSEEGGFKTRPEMKFSGHFVATDGELEFSLSLFEKTEYFISTKDLAENRLVRLESLDDNESFTISPLEVLEYKWNDFSAWAYIFTYSFPSEKGEKKLRMYVDHGDYYLKINRTEVHKDQEISGPEEYETIKYNMEVAKLSGLILDSFILLDPLTQ
jgi:hypothetical protein